MTIAKISKSARPIGLIRSKKAPQNKGFTLMEVVIAVSLLAVVSVVSVSIVANLLRSSVKSQSAIDVEQTSNFVLLKLKNDVAKAHKISVTANTLTIYQANASSPTVTYTVGQCNAGLSLNCIRRGGVDLTDSSSDPSDTTKPNKSAVQIDTAPTYFSSVSDASGNVLAVNVAIKFSKPGVATPGNLSGETVLDTTIVLPSQ